MKDRTCLCYPASHGAADESSCGAQVGSQVSRVVEDYDGAFELIPHVRSHHEPGRPPERKQIALVVRHSAAR
eukprot:15017707-Alexandrium_andersonii.AAC.1